MLKKEKEKKERKKKRPLKKKRAGTLNTFLFLLSLIYAKSSTPPLQAIWSWEHACASAVQHLHYVHIYSNLTAQVFSPTKVAKLRKAIKVNHKQDSHFVEMSHKYST